jgi:formate-dependent nitrite reductase membrane component NrfD
LATPLKEVLERTEYRASLAVEYTEGHAPEAQRKREHQTLDQPTYYDIPAIKKPEWEWQIPAYFYVGGIASGAYITAVLADIRGREEEGSLVRAGHAIALVMAAISPLLLIADLGRPPRWYNMFRTFRPRSMLNMGTWILSFMGLFGGAGALVHLLHFLGSGSRLFQTALQPLRVFSWLGVIPAGFLGSYTGLLLSATNVPLWAGNRLLMALYFFSSALSTGLAATHVTAKLFGSVPEESEARLKRAESRILVVELALTLLSGLLLRGLARPLLTGPQARRFQLGTIGAGMIAPLALSKAGKLPGPLSLLGPVLTLVGGAYMRSAVTEAGKISAEDPRAYFQYTRAGR